MEKKIEISYDSEMSGAVSIKEGNLIFEFMELTKSLRSRGV